METLSERLAASTKIAEDFVLVGHGGFVFNSHLIEYWKSRALKAEKELQEIASGHADYASITVRASSGTEKINTGSDKP